MSYAKKQNSKKNTKICAEIIMIKSDWISI